MEKIKEIVYQTRKTGNTTWILKSAIDNPNCIIVSNTMGYAKQLEKQYFELLSKSKWYKKLWWKIFGRKNPKFSSISSNFRGFKLPIIFDNSSFC